MTATAKPGDKGPERRSSKHAGRNASEARAGSDSTDVDADPACIWGKPSRRWESESTKARLLSTGAVGAACVQRAVRNMGDLAARGVKTEHARQQGAWRAPGVGGAHSTCEAGNDRGGKGPWFRVLRKEWTSRRLA